VTKRTTTTVVRKEKPLIKFWGWLKDKGNSTKNRLISAYNFMLRNNWFYFTYWLLALSSFFSLLLLTRSTGLQPLWLVLAIIFVFLMFSLYRARLAVGVRISFDGIWINIIVILLSTPFFAWVLKAPGFILLLPLYVVNTYYEFETKKSGLVMRKTHATTIALMGIFTMVVAPYAVGLLEMKSSILIAFYSASIAVYSIVLTIVGTFLGIRKPNARNREQSTAIIGLIRMCIVFILITLIAFLTTMYTSDIKNPPNLIATQLDWNTMGKLYPIIMLGMVSVSFPAVFMYMLSIATRYFVQEQGETK
jgi:hypothetical protein